MKLILKILFAPIMLVLWLFTGLCRIVLNVSTAIFSIAAILFAIMGVITIVSDDVLNGCIGLVVAFLFCPFGLPMLATLILAQFYIFRIWLKEKIYS